MPPPAALARYRRELDNCLRSLVHAGHPPSLYRMLRYHMGWEDTEGAPSDNAGKALRPVLCLLACEAAGGDWRKALPVAAALELVHNFSLIHDDIQDRDAERRHRPTVWRLWGEAQAINAGDAMLTLARMAALRLAEQAPPAVVLSAVRLLDERTLEMVEGQVLDIEFEERLDVDVDAYLEMISRKTGALFDAAFSLGALAAGRPPQDVETMGRCGRLSGIAFQVRDDVMGIWGAAAETGKQPAADIRRRKKTLPVLYALQESGGDDLRRIYGKPEVDHADVATVMRVLDEVGAARYCWDLVEEKKAEAVALLDVLDLTPAAGQELRETTEYLAARDR